MIYDRGLAMDSHALLVDGDFKGKSGRVVSHNVSRPNRQITTRNDAAEINQRNMADHRLAETDVVPVLGIVPSVPVPKKIVGADHIVVGWWFAGLGRCGGDGKRKFGQYSRFEDSLRSEERDPMVAKSQSAAK